jgi:sugar phosphate isomerase/epimerase
MKTLLNISTHGNDLETIGHDWQNARDFCRRNGFDGYELYPVSGYDCKAIPAEIVIGLHLRFFVILEPIWRGDRDRLIEIFDDEETVGLFYGGPDRQAVVDAYRQQLELAHHLGCEYVVFHVSQNELEYVYDWQCPWRWQDTMDLSAEIVNEVMLDTSFTGEILFENLWWPGSMRLDSPDEVTYLLERVNYPRCSLVLDTGHVLNKNQAIRSEAEGIEYLLQTLANLDVYRHLVKGVHLTRSLSADYVRLSKRQADPFQGAKTFWDRFIVAHQHVTQIDQHDAFEDPGIARLFDWVAPEYLVFEFTYRDMTEWQEKIDRQKKALSNGMGGQ